MYPLFLLLFLFGAAQCFPRPALVVDGAFGYTHYKPDDLNAVNSIFEKTSRSAGFRGYTVETFSGHAEEMLGVGAAWKHLLCMLEAEIWQEKFAQRGVPFTFQSMNGGVDADENYLFLPVTLMFKYPVQWRKLFLTAGYGPGIMFGSATVAMRTKYNGSRPDDDMTLDFTSGATVIHRLALDALYRVTPWLGVGLAGGYRFSEIPYLQVDKKTGDSFIFNVLFNGGAEKGDKLYTAFDQTLDFIPESERQSFHHLIKGNMTGYYIWLKLQFYLGTSQ